MFNVQSEEDFRTLEAFCRRRLFDKALLSVRANGVSRQKSEELVRGIRERLLSETLANLRPYLRPPADTDAADQNPLRLSISRGYLSNRISRIIQQESELALQRSTARGPLDLTGELSADGPDSEVSEPDKRSFSVLEWDEHSVRVSAAARAAPPSSASWTVNSKGASMLACTGQDLGGDEIGNANSSMWDNLASDLTAKYGSPIPWKPTWKPPPPNPDTGEVYTNWIFAVALDNAPWNWAALKIEDGAPDSVAPNQVLLGLANKTDWAKEVYYWNSCAGQKVSVHQSGPSDIATYMSISIDMPPYPPNPIPSLLFRKPGWFGVWHDVGHFPLFHTRFAEFFGGTKATFIWVVD
jgi:hypothetical protein